MHKDVLRAIETGALAELALIAFVVAFLCILAYAFLMPKREREEAKFMPLDEDPPSMDDDGPSGDGAPVSMPQNA